MPAYLSKVTNSYHMTVTHTQKSVNLILLSSQSLNNRNVKINSSSCSKNVIKILVFWFWSYQANWLAIIYRQTIPNSNQV